MKMLRCNACLGQKKIWGAGMISQHDCKHCGGVGHVTPEMEVEDIPLVEELVEEAILEIVEVKKAKPVVKKAVRKPVAKKK